MEDTWDLSLVEGFCKDYNGNYQNDGLLSFINDSTAPAVQVYQKGTLILGTPHILCGSLWATWKLMYCWNAGNEITPRKLHQHVTAYEL